MKIIIPNNAQSTAMAKALQPYMAKAFRPLLQRLGIVQQKTACGYILKFSCQLPITFPARKVEFTDYEIREAAKSGKFPPGMTAQDLIGVPANGNYRKRDTCLDVAARNGKLPKGTCLSDLLDTRGGTNRRTLFALFETQKPNYTPDITAQVFLKIKEHKWGTFLHLAARSGALPKGTTVSDLITGHNNEGKTPLHIAATWGHLIPCSRADLSQTIDKNGKTAWDYAVQTLAVPDSEKVHWHYSFGAAVRNIIACPVLASKLRPNKIEFHQAILTALLASPKLTAELREKLAQYPQICAAML